MKNAETELAGYNVTVSVRIDAEMEKKLQKIALYEKARVGTMLRMWIQDKVLTTYRDPKFQHWLRQLKAVR